MSGLILPLHMRSDPQADHFKLYTQEDLRNLPATQWIVKHVVPTHGVGAIFGPSQAGKTFLALDLGARISHGMPWFGRKVRSCPVIYVPYEGRGGMLKRSAAWSTEHQRDTGIFYLMDGMNLLDEDQVTELIDQVRRKRWNAPVVVFIDTLAQASAGLDENSSEMSKVLAVGQRIAAALGVVIFVHHAGHSDSDRMRGWSGLPAAMDFSIGCDFAKGGDKFARQFTLAKVKDEESGLTEPFYLKRWALGLDTDAEPITSLVAVQTLVPAMAPTEQDAADDNFVWAWIRDAVAAGEYPSARSLTADVNALKEHHAGITAKRINAAIDRLKQTSRVCSESGSPSGNTWLRAVDAPQKAT